MLLRASYFTTLGEMFFAEAKLFQSRGCRGYGGGMSEWLHVPSSADDGKKQGRIITRMPK